MSSTLLYEEETVYYGETLGSIQWIREREIKGFNVFRVPIHTPWLMDYSFHWLKNKYCIGLLVLMYMYRINHYEASRTVLDILLTGTYLVTGPVI